VKVINPDVKYCREETVKWLNCQGSQDFEEGTSEGSSSLSTQHTIRLIIPYFMERDCQVRKTALKMDGGKHCNFTCGFIWMWKSVTVRTQDILRTKYWGLYLDLKWRKWHEDGQSCVVISFTVRISFFYSVLRTGPCVPRPSILWVSESVYTRRHSVGLPGRELACLRAFTDAGQLTQNKTDNACIT